MSARRPSTLKPLLAAVLCALGLVGAGCSGGSGDAQCGTNDDCSGAEECIDGVCQAPSDDDDCVVDSDCAGSKICINSTCQEESTNDVGPADTGPDTEPADTSMPDTAEDDSGGNSEPPKVESIEPAGGSTGVPVDATVTIEFSKGIDPTSVFPDSVHIVGPNSRRVEADYDKSNLEQGTLVLTPKSRLHSASPYVVVVDEFVTDLASNPLEDTPFRASFTTESTVPQAHKDLARKFAPVIYQGIRADPVAVPDVNADIPTTLDFDGDVDTSNNLESALEGGADANEAKVYYAVVESQTHYFLEYVLYYPSHRSKSSSSEDPHDEHHFTAVTLMVERDTENVVLAEGLELQDDNFRWISHTSDQTGITEVGQNSTLLTGSSSQWTFEDSTHYPLYVTGGFHQPCHWYIGGISGVETKCGHSPEQPWGADSIVVLKPGDSADTYEDAQSGDDYEEMNYALVPFERHFWMMRDESGQAALFGQSFEYEPNTAGEDRPAGYPDENAHRLPKRLNADDTDKFGITPFRWQPFSSPGVTGRGQWTLDPAYVFNDHFNFSNYRDLSMDYCHNYFFEVDNTMTDACKTDNGGGGNGDAGMGDAGMGDAGTNGDAGM